MAVGGYLAVLGFMCWNEDRLVYHPQAAAQYWKGPPPGPVEDVWLTGPAGRVHAWWLPRDGAEGALLFCHGNARNLSWYHRLVPRLRAGLPLSVLIFDYPGYGKSDGVPSEAGCYAAAEAAHDWLAARVAADRIVIWGESLGGGVATHLAVSRPHRALVLDKTFTRLPDVGGRLYPWLPVGLIMRNRFDNLSRVGQLTGPVFISHGVDDDLTPFDMAETLYAAARGPKRLHAMAGQGHYDAVNDACFAELRRFLAEDAPLSR